LLLLKLQSLQLITFWLEFLRQLRLQPLSHLFNDLCPKHFVKLFVLSRVRTVLSHVWRLLKVFDLGESLFTYGLFLPRLLQLTHLLHLCTLLLIPRPAFLDLPYKPTLL
jgi:hypothetical protein